MAAGTAFLLQKEQPGGRKPLEQLMCRRQSDNPTTNDCNCFAHLLNWICSSKLLAAYHHISVWHESHYSPRKIKDIQKGTISTMSLKTALQNYLNID
jgi:hypothetical protein